MIPHSLEERMYCGHLRYLLYHTVTDKVSEYCVGGLWVDTATGRIIRKCRNNRILRGKNAEHVRQAYSRWGD